MLFLPLYQQPVARFDRYVMDDVSKVTLPAWPGQGMDAIVIFRTLSPFVLLSVPGYYFAFHCYLDLCIVSICILARWSRCCNVYVLLGSIVNYCDVTICDQIHPHCVYVCVHVMFGGRLRIISMRSLAGIAKTA